MKVVGESFHQETLARLRPRCVRGVEGRPCFPVRLVREPDNPFDEHAVAVHSEIGPIGHLSRDMALRYGATFAALRRAGFDGASCVGILNGGTPEKTYYGVTLCLDYPEDCEEVLGLRRADGTPATGLVRDRHHSTYVDAVKQMRRTGQEEGAEALLLELVAATEEEASLREEGVASWYYEQLAIIYHKRRDMGGEIAILERYAKAPHRRESREKVLAERLAKARERLPERGA